MHPALRPLTLLLPLVLMACSSTPVATPPAPGSTSAAAATTPSTAATTGGAATVPTTRADSASTPLDADSALGREHSVYFDFDEAAVRSEYASLLQRHGQYLQSHPSLKAVVQGNTDERGGREYNLALGQRRAEAVKSALRVYGVRDAQIEAVSFGEERPRATGTDETAWQQNRRADIVIPR